jgi:4-amino-4-deoxy-L-arabinose transferase-like glycosyltransferase
MLNFSAPFMLAAKGLGLYPHLGARAAVAFMGVATVVLLFFVGRSVGGQIAGVGAALFFATAPLAVIAAHDFKEDIPLAFWLTIQLLFLVRYLKGARPRDLYLAAAALGGAVGTKYTGVAAAILLAGCVLFGPATERRWQRLGNAILLAGVVFLVCTPAILIDPVAFMADTSFEARHAVIGHSPEMTWDRAGRLEAGKPLKISPLSYLWTYHLRHSLVPGISIPGLLLTAVGLFIALRKGGTARRLIASGLVLFYFLLESLPLKPPPFAARYMVAVLPYAALLAGQAVAAAWEGSVARRLVIGVLCTATLGLNGFQAIQQVRAMRPDTRDIARVWMFEHIPQGFRLIVPGPLSYSTIPYLSRPSAFPYQVVLSADRSSKTLEMGMDPQTYVIVSSFDYQRYLDHPDVDPEATRFYRRLFERYSPVATFKVPFRPLGFHNPIIQIFHLADSPPSSAG